MKGEISDLRRQLSQKEVELSKKEIELKASRESSSGLARKVEELQETLKDPQFLHAMGAFYVCEFLDEAMVLFPDRAEELKEASQDFISTNLKYAPPSPIADPDPPIAEDPEVPGEEVREGIDP